MLKIKNITIVYFVTIWFLYNASIISPLFFWIAIPAYLIIPIFASIFIQANLYLNAICRGPKNVNQIVLSFNLSEPDDKWLRLNEILDRQKVHAVFFVTGKSVEKAPGLIKTLVDSGNQIGSHYLDVTGKFGFFSAKRLLTEMNETEELIFNATEKEIQYFRPPFGITNPALRKAIDVIGYQVVGWTKIITITGDLKSDIQTSGIKNGSIIRIDFKGNSIPPAFENFIISLKGKFNIVTLDKLIQPKID
jgi:peptidoglycan-N-acetylglucosamine deacetylase